ncbi:NAD(P)/FAD-dependent oxidoreductase [Tsukamurella paurometabola]|uniref:FAD-dependent oxidoreductase n=1 Tax=Tsukamurella paurometabola TaxID=2061 RepID=A0ABS5NHS7_TSUPA|nr:FAD-dependent oxidoreductase [Tsukamurella paurometabola]MBS4102983.1 FAD-dependent oxidoreductase [Tsukamurella paurometabola]
MDDERVLIVGAGHAAAQLCGSLRQEGWSGEIVLVGDEPSLPYHRPPLSKTYLAGECDLDELLIRKSDFYDKHAVAFRQDRVTSVRRDDREVVLEGGERLRYDHLVLSLGARPRPLTVSGSQMAGVHYLRDSAHVDAIREELSNARHAVIVGAGYIGLETAAALRSLGVDVTVLETAERVLQRVTAAEVSAFYGRVHREEGVDLRLGVQVEALEGDSRIRGVRLTDGQLIECDLLIVGIGVVPNVEIGHDSGLEIENGIATDQYGRTSDPHIYAAGDCASSYTSRYGRRLRLESVPNAVEHAKAIAAAICGKEKPITALPWFWSDQYDLKLQIAGLNAGYDQVVVRGDSSSTRDFTCFYLRDGKLIAADCINQPQEFMFSKRAIAQELSPDPQFLTRPDVDLRELLQPGAVRA